MREHFKKELEKLALSYEAISELLDVAEGKTPVVVNAIGSEVVYTTASGWMFSVFNDCGDWDYIDYFHTPQGNRHECEPEGNDQFENVFNWQPNDYRTNPVWQWPGNI